MHISRIGKIARLPHDVREQLNRRLQNAQLGPPVLEWLNALPEVKVVLQEQFAGQPVNKQNLSQWRRGGYLDWLRHQESRDLAARLAEQAQAIEDAAGGSKMSDHLSTTLAFQLIRTADALLAGSSDPKDRWHTLREVLQELGRLRTQDHNLARLQMDQERWTKQVALACQEAAADDLPPGSRRAPSPPNAAWPALVTPSQSQSNPVKPPPSTETTASPLPPPGNVSPLPGRLADIAAFAHPAEPTDPSSQIKANQAKRSI